MEELFLEWFMGALKESQVTAKDSAMIAWVAKNDSLLLGYTKILSKEIDILFRMIKWIWMTTIAILVTLTGVAIYLGVIFDKFKKEIRELREQLHQIAIEKGVKLKS